MTCADMGLDHVFLEALALFPRIQVVANGYVPYPSHTENGISFQG